MSDEFCAGVKILLKRIESHPEEFTKEPSPWKRLMDAVIASKLKLGDFDDSYYLRALTQEEITALHKAFLPIARQEFDAWVMNEILAEPAEEKHWAVGAMEQAKTNAQNSAKMIQENLFT
jgi:hypothetical protein